MIKQLLYLSDSKIHLILEQDIEIAIVFDNKCTDMKKIGNAMLRMNTDIYIKMDVASMAIFIPPSYIIG